MYETEMKKYKSVSVQLRIISDEGLSLRSFMLSRFSNAIHSTFHFILRFSESFTFHAFLYPFHFYLHSTKSLRFSAVGDVVEKPAMCGYDILALFESEIEAL